MSVNLPKAKCSQRAVSRNSVFVIPVCLLSSSNSRLVLGCSLIEIAFLFVRLTNFDLSTASPGPTPLSTNLIRCKFSRIYDYVNTININTSNKGGYSEWEPCCGSNETRQIRLAPEGVHSGSVNGRKKIRVGIEMAQEEGFEPPTNRLTADRSTTELLLNAMCGTSDFYMRGFRACLVDFVRQKR